MKSRSSEKTESAHTKRILLATAAQRAARKAELTHKQAQQAKSQLKVARRAFKFLKKAAKKADKKAARCEKELKRFLKSQKRVKKHEPLKAKSSRVEQTVRKQSLHHAVAGTPSPFLVPASVTNIPEQTTPPPSPSARM